ITIRSTTFFTWRSACWGVSVALAWLLVGSGSNWSEWLTVAVFVWALGLTTRAVRISSVCSTDGATVPTVQLPLPLSYAPWVGVALSRLRPAGSGSKTVTFVAGLGPLLPKLTVNVTVSPTLGVGLSTDLVTARSAC